MTDVALFFSSKKKKEPVASSTRVARYLRAINSNDGKLAWIFARARFFPPLVLHCQFTLDSLRIVPSRTPRAFGRFAIIGANFERHAVRQLLSRSAVGYQRVGQFVIEFSRRPFTGIHSVIPGLLHAPDPPSRRTGLISRRVTPPLIPVN